MCAYLPHSLHDAHDGSLPSRAALSARRASSSLPRALTSRIIPMLFIMAVYTAGVVLPKPVASCRYWHRSLNPKKLIEVGFSRLQHRMTMGRTIKLYAVPKEPRTQGLMPMSQGTAAGAHELVSNYLKQ